MKKERKIGVIIPSFNEPELWNVLQKTCAVVDDLRKRTNPPVKPYIVVADDSDVVTQATLIFFYLPRLAKEYPRVTCVLSFAKDFSPRGQTRAVNDGLIMLHGLGFGEDDLVFLQDADGEFPPEFIAGALVLYNTRPDIVGVYGSRFLQGKPKSMKWTRYVGIKFLTLLVNTLFATTNISDIFTGSKSFKFGKVCRLMGKRFDLNSEITIALLRQGVISEVSIPYKFRTNGESKLRLWRDGWRNFFFILSESLCSSVDRIGKYRGVSK